MFTKCTPLWREARFQVKICQNGKSMQKHHMFGPLLDVQASFVWQAQWILHVVKGEPDVWAWHFAAVSKTMAGVGHVTRACKDAFHLAGAVQETHESDMLDGQGAHFLRGILEHQIFGFAKIMSRHRCSSSSWLNFRGRRSTYTWSGNTAKSIATRPSGLHSTFYFPRKSRRIASFLMFSSSKIEKPRKISLFWSCEHSLF